MEVRNCKECGKIFNYVEGAPLCPACAKKMEGKFEEVKEYIYDNPRASIRLPRIMKYRFNRLSVGLEKSVCPFLIIQRLV